MILFHTRKQNFSILRHLVGEVSHFEFDAYRVTLNDASDLKLFVGGVSCQTLYCWTFVKYGNVNNASLYSVCCICNITTVNHPLVSVWGEYDYPRGICRSIHVIRCLEWILCHRKSVYHIEKRAHWMQVCIKIQLCRQTMVGLGNWINAMFDV